jgi:tetratricopeptide (TPR) repeat protein
MRSAALPLLVVLGICACSHEPEAAAAAPTATPEVEAKKPARPPRSTDPDVIRLRKALDFGRGDEARAALACLDRLRLGTEDLLLRARFDALSGNAIDAIRKIEAARRDAPKDPDVFATASEIYAAAGKTDAGWQEERAGEAACGEAAELDRARACLWLSRSGGARKGLELLEAARKKDPDLPFTERALSQAHLLVGKEDAAARKGPSALEHARLAASHDPDDVDARRFLSEALLLNGDFEGGVREIEALVAQGQPLGAELALLHKKAGIAALLERDRERAIGHFVAARKLGLSDEELSTGARVLAEEAEARVQKGVEAYKADDLDAARAHFTAALELDPDRIAAKNHLAVVEYKRGNLGAAIALWRGVLETSEKEGLDLPEPVHVNLAKALALSGDVEGARALLEEYLAKHPEGRFTGETRSALDALPPK